MCVFGEEGTGGGRWRWIGVEVGDAGKVDGNGEMIEGAWLTKSCPTSR